MPPRCFPVPAYLAVIAVTLTGEIDHRPSPPRLQLHPPCTCQNLADRREIVVITVVVRIIGIKDLSILREADIFPGGKSGGNAAVRGMQVENSFPSADKHMDTIGTRFSVHWRGCTDCERKVGQETHFVRAEEWRK